jgi:hypothetical protein
MSEAIELIYNRLIAAEKLKAGTAYERLAALVFHMLSERTTVHDLRLRGESEVLHQIDVTVGEGDQRHRILIECKDYEKPVGLGLVRSFWGAVEDLGPDEAYMLTTERFTGPAERYAAAKGITLALLRPPRDEDWTGRARTVHIEIRMTVPVDGPKVQWMADAATPDALLAEVPGGMVETELLQLEDAQGARRSAKQEIDEALAAPLGFEGEWSGEHRFAEPTRLVVDNHEPIKVHGFRYRIKWGTMVDEVVVGDGIGGLAAELVLKTLDGSIHRIFTNRQLQSWTFDPSGRVVPAEASGS